MFDFCSMVVCEFFVCVIMVKVVKFNFECVVELCVCNDVVLLVVVVEFVSGVCD